MRLHDHRDKLEPLASHDTKVSLNDRYPLEEAIQKKSDQKLPDDFQLAESKNLPTLIKLDNSTFNRTRPDNSMTYLLKKSKCRR